LMGLSIRNSLIRSTTSLPMQFSVSRQIRSATFDDAGMPRKSNPTTTFNLHYYGVTSARDTAFGAVACFQVEFAT
jgi:hypothetical protein